MEKELNITPHSPLTDLASQQGSTTTGAVYGNGCFIRAHLKMTAIEIITAIIIHLVIPVIGLLTYLGLISKMQAEKVANPPTIDFLFIFANYGGLLLVILTTLFWKWSAIASLATFYLILGAPIVMGIIAFRNYKSRQLSKYHRWTFEYGVLYFLIAPFSLLIASAFD